MAKLTKKDFWNMYGIITGYSSRMAPSFCLNTFNFILARTLRFGKFQEMIKYDHFQSGFLHLHIPGIPQHRVTISEHVRILEKANLVYRHRNWKKGYYVHFTVNVPGILQLIASWEKSDRLIELHTMASEAFIKSDFSIKEVVPLPTFVQSQEAAQAQSKAAQEKISKRNAERKNFAHVKELIAGFCTDAELEDKTFWTGKTRGQAMNWIKAYVDEGINYREILQEVISKWRHFNTRLKNVSGFVIELPLTFDFEQFYKYRREIRNWLDMNKDVDYSRMDRKVNKIILFKPNQQER